MVIPFTLVGRARSPEGGAAGAARRRVRARRHAMGSHPDGALLRADGHRRRGHARFRPRARRDDGGDDGDRQQPADQLVALRAAVHDGGRPRERVRRGRAAICYLHALIEIGLVLFVITLIINVISRMFIWSMGRQRSPRPRRRGAARRRRLMRTAGVGLSHLVVGLCGAAGAGRARAAGARPVLRGDAGRHVAQPRLLHRHAEAGRRDGRRDGKRHRRLADRGRPRRRVRHPDRHYQRRLRLRVRGERGSRRRAVCRRHPQRRAVDRHRRLRLRRSPCCPSGSSRRSPAASRSAS